MKKIFVFTFNLVMILIFLVNYNNRQIIVEPTKQELPSEAEIVNVNMTIEKEIPDSMIEESQKAFEYLPPDVVKAFADKEWKLAVVSEIDLSGTPFINSSKKEKEETVGFINFGTKTIQIKAVDKYNGFLKLKTLHELCHFADEYYNNASCSSEFLSLYSQYKDIYVEYEFYNIKVTDKNREDILYATSDNYEFFASTLKDYLAHPDYIKELYPELYSYYSRLIMEGEK